MGPGTHVESDFASPLRLRTPSVSEKALAEFDIVPIVPIPGSDTRGGVGELGEVSGGRPRCETTVPAQASERARALPPSRPPPRLADTPP